MPLVNIKLSISDDEKLDELLNSISCKIAELTKKPEKYVMASIETNMKMSFGGSKAPSCYVEIKSIGSLNPREMSYELSNLINSLIGINKERIYINFEDIDAKNWGFNGSTFG